MPASPVLQAAVANSEATGETLGRLDAAMRHAMSLATTLAARRSPIKYARAPDDHPLGDSRSTSDFATLSRSHGVSMRDLSRGGDDADDEEADGAHVRRSAALAYGSPQPRHGGGGGGALEGVHAHLAAARTGASAVEAALSRLRQATATASSSIAPGHGSAGAAATAAATDGMDARRRDRASHQAGPAADGFIAAHTTWDLAHRLAHTQEHLTNATTATAGDAVADFLHALSRV
jgi:hypothetical protein